MGDLDDQPAELGELDLSESAAITGEDVEETLGVEEGSVVKAKPPVEDDSQPAADS